MLLWATHFETSRPLESMPRVLTVASERRSDASYRCEGRFRSRDQHCVFEYSLSGGGVFRDAAGEHHVPPGSGFLCDVSDPETAYYYPEDGRGPWEFVFLSFGGQTALAMVTELVRRHGPIFPLPRSGDTIRRILSWRRFDKTTRSVTASEGAAVVFDLLTALASAHEAGRESTATGLLVAKARDFVRANLARSFSVGELADALGVSREHLTRVFREETSEPPHSYIMRQKILLASHLLKETTMGCKDVCERIGGMVPQHFTRMFKQATGMNPSQFRRDGVAPAYGLEPPAGEPANRE